MADKPIGRPSSFKPEYCQQATELCLSGATDAELANTFDVAVSTIYKWKHDYPEFSEALKAGKEHADERVVRSLYHKAVGYTFDSEKVFQFQGQIIRAETKEHVPPDTTAGIFWLKNRRPEAWRERQQHEHTGKDGEPIQITMTEAARRIYFVLTRELLARATKDPA
jgi:hypothetical protein